MGISYSCTLLWSNNSLVLFWIWKMHFSIIIIKENGKPSTIWVWDFCFEISVQVSSKVVISNSNFEKEIGWWLTWTLMLKLLITPRFFSQQGNWASWENGKCQIGEIFLCWSLTILTNHSWTSSFYCVWQEHKISTPPKLKLCFYRKMWSHKLIIHTQNVQLSLSLSLLNRT